MGIVSGTALAAGGAAIAAGGLLLRLKKHSLAVLVALRLQRYI